MNFRLPEWKYLKDDIDNWLSQLFIRRWINSNPRIVILITNLTVILLILIIYSVVRTKSAPVPEYEKAWYYDLNTGQLFVAENDLATPIQAPSGPLPDGKPAGVKAYVFSYVRNPDQSQRIVSFLEKNDPNYVKPVQNGRPAQWGDGKLVKRITDKKWFPADSKEGKEILSQALTRNKEGESPTQVSPQ